jgi:hypothetical protein
VAAYSRWICEANVFVEAAARTLKPVASSSLCTKKSTVYSR